MKRLLGVHLTTICIGFELDFLNDIAEHLLNVLEQPILNADQPNDERKIWTTIFF